MFRYKSRITPFFNTKNHKNIRRINLKNKNTGKNNNPGKLKKYPGFFLYGKLRISFLSFIIVSAYAPFIGPVEIPAVSEHLCFSKTAPLFPPLYIV